MPQPLDLRLMTEAVFFAKAALQDGKIADYVARIKAVEAIAGLAPGNVSDATMTDLAANPDSGFSQQLRSLAVTPVVELNGAYTRPAGARSALFIGAANPEAVMESSDLWLDPNGTPLTAADIDARAAVVERKVVSDRNNRFAHLGDSLSTVVSGGWDAHWAWVTPFLLEGRLVRVLDAGVGGNTSAQILARVPDVVAANVRYCTVLAGANDGTDTKATKANLRKTWEALIDAGVEPIPILMMPNNADRIAQLADVNAWIQKEAAAMGLVVLDSYTPLVDPVTGNFRQGVFYDAGHPNGKGHIALARMFAEQLRPVVKTAAPLLTSHANDPNNLVNDGVFATPAANGVTGSTWGAAFFSASAGSTANAGASLIPTTLAERVVGNKQRITFPVGSHGRYLFRKTIAMAPGVLEVGDKLRVMGKLWMAGVEANGMITSLTMGMTGTNPLRITAPVKQWQFDGVGVFVDDITVPEGTTAINLEFTAQTSLAAATQATIDLAALTIFNLTKRGTSEV